MPSAHIENLISAAKSSDGSDSSINGEKRHFLDSRESQAFFATVRKRLLDLREWRKSSSATDYDLFDESGRKLEHSLEVGSFVRISLYGSGKYDWVRVIDIHDEPDALTVAVKPSHDPTGEAVDPERISHFFGPEATNNFCVQLIDKAVAIYVIGLNEKQNTEFASGLIEAARNAAIANVGYYSGLQKAVWKEFCTNMLKDDEERS